MVQTDPEIISVGPDNLDHTNIHPHNNYRNSIIFKIKREIFLNTLIYRNLKLMNLSLITALKKFSIG